MYVYYNPNPVGRQVGDCAVRAIAKALDIDWETAFAILSAQAFCMGDMQSSDSVWGSVLRQRGFYKQTIPDSCPDCFTAADFCERNPEGTFVLGFGGHVATVVDGCLFDSFDSSREIPIFVWYRKEK